MDEDDRITECEICDRKVKLHPLFENRFGKADSMVCLKCLKSYDDGDSDVYAFKHRGRFFFYTFHWLLRYRNPHGWNIFPDNGHIYNPHEGGGIEEMAAKEVCDIAEAIQQCVAQNPKTALHVNKT